MANDIRNILTISGNQKLIDEMLKSIQVDAFGRGSIDFKKVLPIPKDLDIPEGSDTREGIALVKDFLDKIPNEDLPDWAKSKLEMKDVTADSYKEQIIDIYSNQKLVRVPLSQNKDFKTIKNAIIKAAANLSIEALVELLPDEHKAKWFAGAALNTSEQSMSSVMSTALSRLNSFLDSELEQILCFDTEIDAEEFCNQKSAIFLIMPEEDPNKFFMISLIIQQLYREILSVADEQGGKLKNRCVFLCDEYGTLPKIESAEMMFSASRSRRLQIVAIIQSLQQLEKNYGKEGAAIIVDNTQLTIFGGFAPNSVTAESMSKALGSRTVMSGSVSRSVNDPSQSLQMIERPLMTADELKSMPKGQFIVMKTGVYPMKVKLQLFFKWGIRFEEAYAVNERGNRMVKYASSKKLISSILEKYPHTSNKENRTYAPPGDCGESTSPPVSVAILNTVKQELDKHETELKTQSTFAHLRDAIIDEK